MKAFQSNRKTDKAVIDISTKDVFVSRGAISCYFALSFLSHKVIFEHIPFAMAGKENSFARKYFNQVLESTDPKSKTKVIMMGTLSKRNTLRSDDRQYQSNIHVSSLLKVNREFENSLDEQTRLDPANISLHVIHIPMRENWESKAVTVGDGEVVVWDEQTNEPVRMFSFEELRRL